MYEIYSITAGLLAQILAASTKLVDAGFRQAEGHTVSKRCQQILELRDLLRMQQLYCSSGVAQSTHVKCTAHSCLMLC